MAHTNADIVPLAIAGRDGHTTNGNMSTDHYREGFTRYGPPYVGHLPRRLADILHERFRAGTVRQVIYSYSTPIAWLDDGVWIIPEVSYSATTSTKHQSQLYRLRGAYVPWDAGMSEYLQVIGGHTRYQYAPGARRRAYVGTGL